MNDDELKRFLHRTMGAATGFGPRSTFRPTEGHQSSEPRGLPELKADADYDLKEQLGRGGMGIVYRARQPRLERSVAVKTIRPELAGSEAVSSFICEARVTGHLAHPNIVPVIDLGNSSAGETYLAMKLVEGQSWETLLTGDKAPQDSVFLDFDDASLTVVQPPEPCLPRIGAELEPHLEILLAVCNAIAFAHSRGFLHRDIKPANVMLGEFGEVLVMDWGLAVDFSASPSEERPQIVHRNEVHEPWGTPCFLAPEMARGAGSELGPWTDVYLLGATLHEVVTKAPPHQGQSYAEVLRAARDPEPQHYHESVPQELQEILRKSMAKEARDRYQSVLEFRQAIRDFQKHGESLRLSEAASRTRLEAVQLSDSCESDVQRTRAYAAFGSAIAGFEQALTLWPENQSAQAAVSSTRHAFASSALSAGDLALARAQLDNIKGPLSNELGAKIATEEARRRNANRTTKRLRRGIAAASLVVVIAIAILALRWGDIERGRKEAERLRIENLLQDGFYELGEGSNERAVAIFSETIETSKDLPPEAVAGLALAHMRSNQVDQAEEILNHYAPEENDPTFGWLRVEVYRSRGEDDRATQLSEELGSPQDAISHFVVGVRESYVGHNLMALGDAGDLVAKEQSLEAFRASLDHLTSAMIHSESLRALYLFNRAHSAGHSLDEAAVEECANLMTRRFPESPHAWFWAGFSYERLGGHSLETTAAYREALALEPENPTYVFCLGTSLMLSDVNQSRELLERAIALKPDHAETLCNLGHVYGRLGLFKKSLDFLRRGDLIGRSRAEGWIYPSREWIREAEGLLLIDEEVLPEILAGKRRLPLDDPESLITIEYVARKSNKVVALTDIYKAEIAKATALTHPNLFFRAACAALAVTVVDGEELQSRKHYRQLALAWIKESLTRCMNAARAGYMSKELAHKLLSGSLSDPSLDPIREGKGLSGLPDDEARVWTELWRQAYLDLQSLSDE